MSGQTRLGSLAESLANIAIGIFVAFVTQLVVFPAVGVSCSIHQNLEITGIFTVVSIVRSYCLRRLFNLRARR